MPSSAACSRFDIASVAPAGALFQPFQVGHLVDGRGRYHLELDKEFPLFISCALFESGAANYPMNWHERLEVFFPVAGQGAFRMGDRLIRFEAGDLIVVDNNRLHGLTEFHGPAPSVVSISFQPELIVVPGGPVFESEYLGPFLCRDNAVEPVVRGDDAAAPRMHDAVAKLLRCYESRSVQPLWRAGCKAHLLELLYLLAVRFEAVGLRPAEFLRQRERVRRLGRLFDHLHESYADTLPVREAARIAGMSESRFMRFFRIATGMTYIQYVTHVRLNAAARMLRETSIPICEVALAAGFPDQGYFDRRFKQAYKTTPREFRGSSRA